MKLGLEEPIVEEDYEVLSSEEHAVWNAEHPAPEGGVEYETKLTRQLAERDEALISGLVPTDKNSLNEYKRVIGGAF
ncbi:MAG: hypothetical protein R3C11_05470 [Planctomycetaceae bacterium]